MNLLIPFDPAEEARLTAAARKSGVAPADLIKQLVLDHLPPAPLSAEAEMDARIREWQDQDGTPLGRDTADDSLFARWAEEDALMTDAERDAEDRLWDDIEKSLVANSALRLRHIAP
jgi:hypothetical protein